jgi:hypothetical protein
MELISGLRWGYYGSWSLYSGTLYLLDIGWDINSAVVYRLYVFSLYPTIVLTDLQCVLGLTLTMKEQVEMSSQLWPSIFRQIKILMGIIKPDFSTSALALRTY